jgi:tetratricopeptide (TPR) repeat protein
MATFARTHWETFERLAVAFLADQFGTTPTKIWRTVANHDGGYDGGAVVELAELAGQVIAHKTMLEAKLRSHGKDLELAAFAKTLIVGFNLGVNSLVVVTNLDFSPQALREARDFAYRARLDIVLVDGGTLSGWVRARWQTLVINYETSFLTLLLRSEQAAEPRVVVVPPNGVESFAPSAEIRFGFADGRANDCRIALRTEAAAGLPAFDEIIGDERRSVLDKLIESVCSAGSRDEAHPSRYVLLRGEAGVGKSHLVRRLAQVLTSGRRPFTSVRLDATTTPYVLFLRALEAIVGVSILQAAEDVDDHGLARFLAEITGRRLPNNVIAGAAAVLSRTQIGSTSREIDQLVLVDFMRHMLRARGLQPGTVISFQDIHSAAPEVLDFMQPLAAALKESGCTVLFEAREIHDVAANSSVWDSFLSRVRQLSGLVELFVPAPTPRDAGAYVTERLSGLDQSHAAYIVSRVGTLPLLLEVTIEWLLAVGVVRMSERGLARIEKLERFFENLTPDSAVTIIDRLISHWLQRDTQMTKLLLAASLLDGDLTQSGIAAVLEAESAVEAMDRLLLTKLFASVPSLTRIYLKHALLRERLEILCDDEAYRFRRKQIAELLLPHVDSIYGNPVDKSAKRADLYAANGSTDQAYVLSEEAGQLFWRQHQWQRAAHYLRQSFRFARQEDLLGQRSGIWVRRAIVSLLKLLELEDERYRLTLSENLEFAQQLERIWTVRRTGHDDASKSEGMELQLRAGFLRWRREFTQESFADALTTAVALSERAAAAAGHVSPNVVGKALAALGTTYKALRDKEKSRQAYERAVELEPNSIVLRAQQWSNEAAFHLQADPTAAHVLYENIIALRDNDELPFLAVLHATVDLAMASFLAKAYRTAELEALAAISLAEANGIPAQGARGLNILGCCLMVAGRVEQAAQAFNQACLDAERSLSYRFLWRIRTNQASATLALGNSVRAVDLGIQASQHIVRSRAGLWPSPDDAHTTRWYAALLEIGRILAVSGRPDECRTLEDSVPVAGFANHLTEISAGRFPSAVFGGTSNLHSGKILITG